MFDKVAGRVAKTAGHAWVFIASVVIVLLWLVLGPVFDFNDTWQLVINTATTIITFLMIFLVQNTQNRDSMAVNAKLDALIDKSPADDTLQELEKSSEKEIKKKVDNESRTR